MLYNVNENVHMNNVVFFQFRILQGMVKNIRGVRSCCRQDYRAFYTFWRQKTMKQAKSDDDLKSTTTIGLGSKSANY